MDIGYGRWIWRHNIARERSVRVRAWWFVSNGVDWIGILNERDGMD